MACGILVGRGRAAGEFLRGNRLTRSQKEDFVCFRAFACGCFRLGGGSFVNLELILPHDACGTYVSRFDVPFRVECLCEPFFILTLDIEPRRLPLSLGKFFPGSFALLGIPCFEDPFKKKKSYIHKCIHLVHYI